ncbi:coproporphyrinogen III oxidase [Lachnospiraceae bacterium]|uniref:coproporphyrinogen dehydrogenase HemZ n=1 Tax=Extibacter sp. GGCC_0201 TaxID=2731209 RepID=UPI001AA1CC03|nr:coproporphyrinogen dehydrogenase HemZ [Extibacter sp. GGCC_0201]MBO1720979.1 coproporphyrinogen dehydrogenase HemZ [Extibacter sp. GGCC_0201]BDF33493.1 coproporphyrinogen III oxidase [Lachnospiraceae bacterium]BDF37497.1 coproporphyrinogen III oxidase [Lachnospiraceae bacterium]
MIEIISSDELYTYNVYHIMKAFFPEEKVHQLVETDCKDAVRAVLPDCTVLRIGHKELPQHATRQEWKRYIDRELYKELERHSGRSLAWGLLTGVRPTKIAMKKLEEGMQEEEFLRFYMDRFFVDREKARLAWEIAGREKELLGKLDCTDGYSLYVAIPFCPSVCTYCSFSSGPLDMWKDRVDDYLDGLTKELAYIGGASASKKLNTIYIGGGTPTTLTARQLERLLACIDRNFDMEHLLEYTVEAGRPDSITAEKLKVLRRHHVTRISINPQSMQQKTLDLIGRHHTVEDVVRTYEMAREAGFDNINMDLIAGLPGETAADVYDTLRQTEALSPDSLTVHSLAIKRAALMGQEQNARGYVEALDKDAARMAANMTEMIRAAAQSARRMDLKPYYLYRQKNIAGNFENVGYAKVDKAGIYNILIMEEKQSIIAAGAGASTKIVLKEEAEQPGSKNGKKTNLIRIENVKAVDAYIARIGEMIERKGEWLWR